jgi:hypothetical protein
MKFLTLLALFGAVTRIPEVAAESSQPPLKLRLSTDILKLIFHSRD